MAATPGGFDAQLLADVVDRLLGNAHLVAEDMAAGRVGRLSLLVADCQLLAETTGPTWTRDDLLMIAAAMPLRFR